MKAVHQNDTLGATHPSSPPSEAPVGAPLVAAIVDGDAAAREIMRAWVRAAGMSAVEYADATHLVESPLPSIVLLDVEHPSALRVIEALKQREPDLPIIALADQRAVGAAAQALRAGAYDHVYKPLEEGRLLAAVRRAAERRDLALRVRRLTGLKSLVAQSPPMREVVRQIERALDNDAPVCLVGEPGSGKALVARTLHANGRRKSGPFVAVGCAAIAASAQESELFGVDGPLGVRRGRFEEANGGTILLDHVDRLTPAAQAGVLRAITERVVRRVGGTVDVPVNVRIVGSTEGGDVDASSPSAQMSEELFFKLVVFPIRLPPLRARVEDVPLLVSHFLRKLAPDVGRRFTRVSPDVLEALMRHKWPGNVAELENVLHRAMLACEEGEIAMTHLPPSIQVLVSPDSARDLRAAGATPVDDPFDGLGEDTVMPLRELERRAIERALKVAGGSVGKAAKLLGMGRATLYRRIADFDSAAPPPTD